jgi:hypothetical protein
MIMTVLCLCAFWGVCFADGSTTPATEPSVVKASAAPTTSTTATVLTSEDKEKAALKNRFVKIFQDTSYTYYVDTKTEQWTYCPNTTEQVIDVWIKLVSVDDTTYSYPETYLLEHYYIRPDKQQIQFLCEIEVAGRPNNAIQQREYSAANWENLVPGSVEDSIYQAVVANTKNLEKKKVNSKTEVRDFVEELFRVSF